MIFERLVLHRHSATVPPPGYYEYRIELRRDSGRLVYRPGYGMENPPTWEMPFHPTTPAVSTVQRLITEVRLFERWWPEAPDHVVGGALTWLEGEGQGRSLRVEASLAVADRTLLTPLYEAIKQTVPDAIWQEIHQRRASYRADF